MYRVENQNPLKPKGSKTRHPEKQNRPKAACRFVFIAQGLKHIHDNASLHNFTDFNGGEISSAAWQRKMTRGAVGRQLVRDDQIARTRFVTCHPGSS